MIHPLADCQNKNISESTNVWQYCVVLPGAQIGENVNICSHCFIENDVKIGNNVTIKCGVQVWDGIELEDNVMIGSNVTFTNDVFPRAKNKKLEVASHQSMQRCLSRCWLHLVAWNNNR